MDDKLADSYFFNYIYSPIIYSRLITYKVCCFAQYVIILHLSSQIPTSY